ncbi:hypothetical protein LITTLEE_8 [Mycobacterium phage LittleE]|uniref:Terminase small subunit n=4 Tax=Omegavirus TaxID=1623292 RepID=Q854Q4_BPMOM|nr:terminase small subunit [Mycobacterium phage Omega]YP_008410398.1 terminase small subunit [Mycobacterium phage Wanda]YP_009011908.1 terminase small subunit [Mycobacterium phage Courthouse]YP_009205138.1 terminase small subunit [Mycobacterium phage Ariel]YP_009213226.1 terminase small subunit [Mycobacterium phage MiaZeal]YP_009636919.1 terminase small subunit [Mycobacterium phage LittleE]ASD50651.1 hypothetical protein PORCELAIN_9 [Mycobacterium phage Porcelain]ASD53402.1 hypothetical prot
MALTEGLGARGAEVYQALTENRKMNAAQKVMALNAARLADTLDRIESELAFASTTVINSQGTETINPLISEARMLTGALCTILAKMGIAELPEQSSGEKSVFDQLAARRAERLAPNGGSGAADMAKPGS